MAYESPYQAMMENELLFQQQPWVHRVPYQIQHALRPAVHALTGVGAGYGLGRLGGHPGIGALAGLAAGTAYGAVSPQPTPAQEWAFHNPEKVHVLRARAAYDFDHGGVPQIDGKTAALRAYGLVAR